MDTEHGNGRNDQIVSQFLLKALHIVLESRVPSIRHNLNLSFQQQVIKKKSDKWFNLALDRPTTGTALDSLNFWHRNLMEPMIIDIILVSSSSSELETVIERWVIQYEYSKLITDLSSSYKKTYKKSILLLRSLYTMMRLLPAYRAYRKLKPPCSHFHINYKVSSFSAPFTRQEEQLMKQYTFFPVEAQHGRLSISLKYRQTLSDFNLETSTSFPPEIITDYVGSPATDPFRAFPPIPNMNTKGVHATSLPVRDMQHSPQRPHSWTGGFMHNQSPPAHRSSSGRYDLSSSPSPTPTPNTSDVYGQRNRPPTHPSFDDYQLSPPFSPSPSPSPPTYLSGRLTAPVSIPNPMITRYVSPNLSDPNRHSLPPSGIRCFKKSEMSRVGDLSSGSGSGSANHYSSQKVSRDGKDDSGRFSGLLSSSGSPRIGFSRSSSRLSLEDELDDIDFSCPFVVDDVDTYDSSLSESKKSQDAAVGALVRMLRRAPPLRQEDSSSCYSLNNNGNGGSGLFMSGRKTSTDALEDLKAYTDIKHLILSKSGTNSLIH